MRGQVLQLLDAALAASAVRRRSTAARQASDRRVRVFVVVCLLAMFWAAASSLGQRSRVSAQAKSDGPLLETGQWQLDRIYLEDGKRLEGLVLSENSAEVEFAEIRREPGKPMNAVVRPIDKDSIKRSEYLDLEERRRSLERYERFRHRAKLESRRLDSIEFEPSSDNARMLVWRGPRFLMESTTGEEVARYCAVRCDQIFLAYQQLIPASRSPESPPRIRLLGNPEQYKAELRLQDVQPGSPAVYLPRKNLVVARSDFNRVEARFEEVAAKHRAIRDRLTTEQNDRQRRWANLAAKLRKEGYTEEQISDTEKAERSCWVERWDARRTQLRRVEMRNQVEFADYSREMFARLYHEAFHAYLDSYVYTEERGRLPIWLEEGLAQIFESSRLENEALLRIDAPDPRLLERLQEDLNGTPLSLEEVLTDNRRHYNDRSNDDAVRRRYLYAWGVTYYLLEQNKLPTSQFHRLLCDEAGREGDDHDLLLRRLLDGSLEDFEPRWRAAMLEMRVEG